MELATADWACTTAVSTLYATHTVKRIGSDACGTTTSYLNAVIEEIAIVPRVLTAAETGDVASVWQEATHYYKFR